MKVEAVFLLLLLLSVTILLLVTCKNTVSFLFTVYYNILIIPAPGTQVLKNNKTKEA